MKAWIGKYSGEGWVMLMHGETKGKAKANFHAWNPDARQRNDFVEVRVRRIPALDNLPFTYDNARDAGFYYQDEDGTALHEPYLINDCICEICKANQ